MADFHVSKHPSALDDPANDGTNATTEAWLTINYGIQQISAGDTLLVHVGEYAEEITWYGLSGRPSGTSFAIAVTVRNFGTDIVTVKPPSSKTRCFDFFNSVSYVIIDGLILDADDVSRECIKMTGDDVDHIRIINCELKNVSFAAGLLMNSSNLVFGHEILNTHIHDIGRVAIPLAFHNHGIYNKGQQVLIDGCHIEGIEGVGIHSYEDEPPHKNLVHDNIYSGNEIHDTGRGDGGSGILIASGDNNIVRNNLVYNCHGGILVRWFNVNDTKVSNNTVIRNNKVTISFPARQGIWLQNASGTTRDTLVKNNIAYDNDAGDFLDQATGTVYTFKLETNPQVVSLTFGSEDFHLTVNSTDAIDKGTTLAEVTDDFDGNPRPSGLEYDIGAFEFTGAGGSAPVVAAPVTKDVIIDTPTVIFVNVSDMDDDMAFATAIVNNGTGSVTAGGATVT